MRFVRGAGDGTDAGAPPYLAALKARGNHLAPVVLALARAEHLYGSSERYADFILRMVAEGHLVPGELAQEYAVL